MNVRLGAMTLLLCVGMAATSCILPAVDLDCAELYPAPLTRYLGRAIPPAPQLGAEIKGAVATESIRYSPPAAADSTDQPPRFVVGWDTRNSSYAISVENGINVRSQVSYSHKGPSLSALLVCLGPPQEYWAWYGETFVGSGWATYIMLLYPDRGITVWGADFTKRQLSVDGSLQNPAALNSVPVESIVYTTPASSAMLVARAWSFDEIETSAALRRWYVEHIKPWPGRWEAVEVLREPRP